MIADSLGTDRIPGTGELTKSPVYFGLRAASPHPLTASLSQDDSLHPFKSSTQWSRPTERVGCLVVGFAVAGDVDISAGVTVSEG